MRGEQSIERRAAHVHQNPATRADHVFDEAIRMAHGVDDRVERIRAEGVVLLREWELARFGEVFRREAERRHHALHAHALARSGAAEIDPFTAKLRRGAYLELAPGDDRERLGLTREQH